MYYANKTKNLMIFTIIMKPTSANYLQQKKKYNYERPLSFKLRKLSGIF